MAKSGHDTTTIPMPEVRDVAGTITEGGVITVPIKLALREPERFVRTVQVAYTVDGEPARLIQRLQHGMNVANMRKSDGKHVSSIGSVVEAVLDQIADQYAAEVPRKSDADDDGLRTYRLQVALMDHPSGVRPVTVWKQLHGLRAKTLQRLLAGLNGCCVRRVGGKQIKSHDAVVKYLFEQVQVALAGEFVRLG